MALLSAALVIVYGALEPHAQATQAASHQDRRMSHTYRNGERGASSEWLCQARGMTAARPVAASPAPWIAFALGAVAIVLATRAMVASAAFRAVIAARSASGRSC